MTPSERAEQAKEILNSEVMRSVFAAVREELVSALEAVPFGDVDTQHHTALELQALKRIQTKLHRYVDELAVIRKRESESEFMNKNRKELLKYINPA